MARMTGQEMFEKYRRNMSNATTDIKRGIETTDKDQAVEAIKAKPQMIENHRKAMEAGKWEKGLQEAGHAKWKRNMLSKGVPKITAGIDANSNEIIAKMEKVGEAGEAVRNATKNMPKGTMQDSLARVEASMKIQKAAWNKEE